LLERLTGGVAVRESLNVEFAAVAERRADLLLLLEDESIFHLDFQSENDRDMPYREGIYGLMAGQKYRRRVRQVVLYAGQERMRMPAQLDLCEIQVAYRLVDIREFDAAAFLEAGHPGDYALALLAQGGTEHLREILRNASRLPGPQREKVMAQLVALSGLRRLSGKLTMEMKSMGIAKYVDDHPFLREIRAAALAQGRAEGKAEGKAEGEARGRAEGKAALLQDQLHAKFGPLPKWARSRVQNATPAQLDRWAKKVLKSESLEETLGKR
jgi:predicted transposase YdaD